MIYSDCVGLEMLKKPFCNNCVCVRVGVWMCTRGQCIWQGRAYLWPSGSHFN